ncbi:MAG: capsular polysaccharide synthesis protein [Treponema sp.]|nr:capsular polysaccharide synthesis protein [Treponema sp.]
MSLLIIKKALKSSAAVIKSHGLYHGLRKIFYGTIIRVLTDHHTCLHLLEKSSAGIYNNYYLKHFADRAFSCPENDIKPNELVYWTCWLQGIENAPLLVKSCYKSLKRISSGHRVILITYENLKTYITLPDTILEKHKKGCLSGTHFSEIIRTYLLYTYGGVWCDATVLFTALIPEKLLKKPLFFFMCPLKYPYTPVSSWFIIANKKGNILLYRQLCNLINYWEKEKYLIDYFIYHHFIKAIIENDSESRAIFDHIPYYSNQNPHYLQFELLFNKFDPEQWENVRETSFCHKLTYKIGDKTNKNVYSFYNYIIEKFS